MRYGRTKTGKVWHLVPGSSLYATPRCGITLAGAVPLPPGDRPARRDLCRTCLKIERRKGNRR